VSKCAPDCHCGRHSQVKKRDKGAICEGCGGQFLAHRRDARYCSHRCWSRATYNSEAQREKTRRWREKQPQEIVDARREYQREHWHAAQKARTQRFRDSQDGKCYLCGDPLQSEPRSVHLDHDHRCCPKDSKGCVACQRGLACRACNLLLCYASDDPDRLRRIADNLERAIAAVDERLAEGQGILFLAS
jgi:Recombination endonuclease VII